MLRNLPYELGKLFHLVVLGLHGNPLTKDILSIYNDINGTNKLLTHMLDNYSREYTSKLFLYYLFNWGSIWWLTRQHTEPKVHILSFFNCLNSQPSETRFRRVSAWSEIIKSLTAFFVDWIDYVIALQLVTDPMKKLLVLRQQLTRGRFFFCN